jgi:hypothetical protein
MSYVVNNSRGQIIAVVQDGTINTTATSQTLVGKNVTPYGEYEVENLVHQLENFANSTPPGNPITGQLWYDTTNTVVNVYTGTAWRPVSDITVSTSEPNEDPQPGDLWFNSANNLLRIYGTGNLGVGWVPANLVPLSNATPTGNLATGQIYLNTVTNQLYIFNGSTWNLIGPEAVGGFAATKWFSTSMFDQSNTAHAVMQGIVNGTIIAIASADTFTLNSVSRPDGFANLVPGINMSTTAVLAGRATNADKLTVARTINGVSFDGTSNITIANEGALLPGEYIDGSPYSGTVPQTWNVAATSASVGGTIVARDSNGDFSARNITANLSGSVTGTATNVTGVVAAANGGTGQNLYNTGDILIGSGTNLNKGRIVGQSPIQVTANSTAITIGYSGGEGTGTVTSVGIINGPGISVSDSPVTSSGNITVSNTGVLKIEAGFGIKVNRNQGNVIIDSTGVANLTAGSGIKLTGDKANLTVSANIVAGTNISITNNNGALQISSTAGGGGGGSVYAVTAGDGLLGGQITTAGTIAVDDSVVRTIKPQTITTLKTFTGGIISQAYNFTNTGASIFYADASFPNYQEPVVAIPVNAGGPASNYSFATQVYNKRFVVEGSADATTPGSDRPTGGAIIGIDNGITGGSGVLGIHTSAQPGLGVGVTGLATNMSFTGMVIQTGASRSPSTAFGHIRCYSAYTGPGTANPVFYVLGEGSVYADGGYYTPASDYAEYFEWVDGNPNNEDRVGITVALDGNRIRPAVNGDRVIGVVSVKPSVIGDAAEAHWKDMYLTDDWGRELTEPYHSYEWVDDNGTKHSAASYQDTSKVPKNAVKKTTDELGNPLTRPVLNPNYDPANNYVPRSKRKEWAAIGLLGKLRVRVGETVNANWIKLRDITDDIEEWLVK